MRPAATAILACMALLAPAVRAAPAGAATARVTYLAGSAVYIEAGRAEGIAVGDTLVVERDSAVVTSIRVTYLSTHRASCEALPGGGSPQVGDTVRFTPHPRAGTPSALAGASAPSPPASAPLPSPPASAPLPSPPAGAPPSSVVAPGPAPAPPPDSPARRSARRPLAGRIGLRYLAAQSREAGDFGQAGLDLWLQGHNVGQNPIDLTIDARSRHTRRDPLTDAGETEAATRIYRMAATVHDDQSRRRLTIGRQSSPALGAVSLFDGVLAETRGERYGAGVFSGMQPAPGGLGFSREIVEYGGYFEWRQPPLAANRWSVVSGLVASTSYGENNRTFLFFQGYYGDARSSLSVAQELDFNFGWKEAAGEPSVSLTSTFVSARTRVHPALEISGGVDSRRNVRLYSDRTTPESEFDMSHRQGAWAGGSIDVGRNVRLHGDARLHRGGTSGSGHSWSAAAEASRMWPVLTRVRGRYARFRGDLTASDLVAAGLGLDPLPALHLEIEGGARNTSDALSGLDDRELWESATADWSLGWRLLLTASVEHGHGDLESRFEEASGLSWRF